MLSEKFNDENFSGQSEISIFRQKIRLKYEQNKDDFIFKTEKNNNLKLSGTITKSPFYFDIQIFLNNSNIKNIQILLSKLGNYLNNNYLLNKNFNGKLLLNIKDIHGSKYFNSTKILISFSNGKISLDESKIYIKKLDI